MLDAVRARIAQLREDAAVVRERARTYYELADERGRRGSDYGAAPCCELGWVATEKALALEAEAERLERAHGLATPPRAPALARSSRVEPSCPACGQPVSAGSRDASSGCCSAACAVTAYRGGLIAKPSARA